MSKSTGNQFVFSGGFEEAKEVTRFHAAFMASRLEIFEYVLKIVSDAGVVIDPRLKEMMGGLLGDYKKAAHILALRAFIDEGQNDSGRSVYVSGVDEDGKIVIKYKNEDK